MNWPTHTDYQDAMQNPQICFSEAELKAGTAACDMLGLPRVMSGNFASVYELSTEGQRWAVRCFVRQVMGQQGRYQRLCAHLGAIPLPWLVKFDYYLKGILVKGEWYPIVKMEWVAGSPINTWVDDNHGDAAKLKAVASQWRKLVSDLREHKLAHGDFQHGNIMVTTEDELRLVDYDGMYCPAFGKGRSPELGHANFQHPRRLPENYDDTLDNFSALVIHMSLLALAEDPSLWKEFYTGDNLLLTSGDFKNPQNSKAFTRLKENKSETVRQLANLIQQCAMRSMSDVPWFEETVAAAEKGTLAAQVAAMPAPSATDSWLENAEAGDVVGSRPAPQVSRPSPIEGSRPAGSIPTGPTGTRISPMEASRPATSIPTGPSGTRISPPPAPPAPPKAAPAPAPKPPAPTAAPALEEEKQGLPKYAVVVGAVVLVVVLIFLLTRGGSSAPNIGEPPAAQNP